MTDVDKSQESASGWRIIRTASFESGGFDEFDATSTENGRLSIRQASPAPAEGARYASAFINGGGNNAYARPQWTLSWSKGTTYRTEVSFFLPNGFYQAQTGAVQLVGWDSWPEPGQMRLAIWNSDKRARLFMQSDGRDSVLTNAFSIPEGRWVRLAIEQHLGDGDGWSKVYLDGQLVAQGSGDTATPYPVTRMRYGIVANAGSEQKNDLVVHFDRIRLAVSDGSTTPPSSEQPPAAKLTSPPPTTPPTATPAPPPPTATPAPPPPTATPVPPSSNGWRVVRSAGMEAGNFSEFDATSVLEGSLSVASNAGSAAEGSRAGSAKINGTGKNAYSRGQWQVNWREGTVYRTEASFYLPSGFYRSMMGAVQLLGWDAYPNLGQMRLAIWNSDKKARLFMKSDSKDTTLTNAFSIPEGRWVHVAVEQKIANNGGWSKVYLDGKLVAEGSGDTATPYPVTRIRYGLVAIDGGAQKQPLTVFFDRVRLLMPS